MQVKAETWSGHRNRIALIALVCLGFACWCLYDAVVRYPTDNEIVETYENLLPAETRDDQWPQVAREHGWPEEPNGLPHRHEPSDIFTQYVMLAISGSIGLVFGFTALRCLGRWIACDENGLTTSWGQSVAFDQITRLNLRRWKKGYATVYYTHEGNERKLAIDDWKFDREPTDQIVAEVQARLSPEQIDGPLGTGPGARSSPPDDPQAEEESERRDGES